MNCKPGDLAIVVDAIHTRERIGRVVRCVRIWPDGKSFEGGRWLQVGVGFSTWLVDDSREQWLHDDSRLRPIRDQDGEDETLTWAGKPNTVKTPEVA